MNVIFFGLIFISVVFAFYNGKADELTNALLNGCNTAVKVSFSLIGIMSFWLGIMKIAEKSGLINIISKIITPIIKPLFKDIPKDSDALGDITMSLSANALGLTNAATPIGIKVMQDLQECNKDKDVASDSMCMFLGMNTAGFQIIPATVIAILVGLGAKNPTDIIVPTLIVTALAFVSSIVISLILQRVWLYKELKK